MMETSATDREIIDLIKENILEEKKRNEEYCQLQKDYIEFLKFEISHKNKIINNHLHLTEEEDIETSTPNVFRITTECKESFIETDNINNKIHNEHTYQ